LQRDPIYAPLKLASPDGAIANLDGNAHTPVAIHRRDLLVQLTERRARGQPRAFRRPAGIANVPSAESPSLEGLIFGS
jgi:hypothetical protein